MVATELSIASAELLRLASNRINLRSWAGRCVLALSQALLIFNVEAIGQARRTLHVLVCAFSEATVASEASI